MAGVHLFAQNCAVCHGDSKGLPAASPIAKGLYQKPPDPDRILRVFVNLLDNALKFTQRPGHVVLRAQEQPEAVRFSIANSGPALSAEELDSMFQPFWQARDDRRGASLGLSMPTQIRSYGDGSVIGCIHYGNDAGDMRRKSSR